MQSSANLICRISAANWPLSVSTRAEICKLFWSAVICLFGGRVWWGYFWTFEFFWVLKNFCFLVHFAVVLFVYKVAGTHHVMNTDTGWHRHAEETTKYATGVEFHKNTKADFIAMFRWKKERDVDANEEMKSEWTTFLSQLASAARTVVPAIGRPGVSYSNCLSIEHSYQTPLPHTPVLHIELQNSLKCCFPKRLGPNMKDEVYNFHRRRSTYKIDHPSQISIFFGHNSSFNFCLDKITHCTHQLHQLLFVFTIKILQSPPPPSAPLPPVSINHSVHIPLHCWCWPIPPRNGW